MNKVSARAMMFVALLVLATTSARADDPAYDKVFADQAMASGLAEVAAGKLALDKSQNDNVRKFAQRMVQDHSATNADLAGVAKSEGLGLPTVPTEAQRAELARLGKLSGAEFDQAYLAAQVADHRAAVALFLRESKTAQDAALRQVADRALPILNDHLQMAQALATAH